MVTLPTIELAEAALAFGRVSAADACVWQAASPGAAPAKWRATCRVSTVTELAVFSEVPLRRICIAIVTAALLSVAALGSVSAHVHGITPLRCVGVEDDGANRTDLTPAPIGGLIPSTVGQAPIGFGDGGFDTPACPAD